ncbi:hypothetical protein LSTR_LSTR016703 [Laodelphax striatellus]|uniref:Uncharacterized protein n=1 Tax=Laodelphax striatellus TaxID=195883 RepID=A0A482WP76_LAOST|nr:hypothetical protein LSTR_LSTR016703 [Laodelphax striatellus]
MDLTGYAVEMPRDSNNAMLRSVVSVSIRFAFLRQSLANAPPPAPIGRIFPIPPEPARTCREGKLFERLLHSTV